MQWLCLQRLAHWRMKLGLEAVYSGQTPGQQHQGYPFMALTVVTLEHFAVEHQPTCQQARHTCRRQDCTRECRKGCSSRQIANQCCELTCSLALTLAYLLKACSKDRGAGAGAGANVAATVTRVPYTLLLARMLSVTLLVPVMLAKGDVTLSAQQTTLVACFQ